jgi:transposase InsO family protein
VWLVEGRTIPEVLLLHANAVLSPRGRLALARCVVEDGWPLRRAAERFQVSATCAARWAKRYRECPAGVDPLLMMRDRSSRPRRSPNRTTAKAERRIIHLRRTRGWGPARIGHRLGMHPSTVHRVLLRNGCQPLAHLDLATRRELRARVVRYERDRPGELVHVDIKKLGRIPDGGGHRFHGRRIGTLNKQAHTPDRHNSHPVIGYGYVHTAVDDHSRLAYSEVLSDEQGPTAAAFWHRAVAFYAEHGIHIEQVLTDNGSCYRSKDWTAACAQTGTTAKKTRPYRPQTNGKVERFNRTLLTEWAYARPYASERARTAALRRWLHIYNHHRTHTALGGRPPVSRVTNLSGQYT